MNFEFNTFTRREALLQTLKGTVAAAVATPIIVQAAPEVPTQAEATFVPENDHPFFSYELPQHCNYGQQSMERLPLSHCSRAMGFGFE